MKCSFVEERVTGNTSSTISRSASCLAVILVPTSSRGGSVYADDRLLRLRHDLRASVGQPMPLAPARTHRVSGRFRRLGFFWGGPVDESGGVSGSLTDLRRPESIAVARIVATVSGLRRCTRPFYCLLAHKPVGHFYHIPQIS